MKSQVGARWLALKNREVKEPAKVMLNAIKRTSKLIRLKSGAVKRRETNEI